MELPPASEPTGKKSILHREEPEADNQAIFTAAAYGKAMGKHHMIFSSIEHHAVLNCIPALKKAGFEITQIGVDPWGRVSMEELKSSLQTGHHSCCGNVCE